MSSPAQAPRERRLRLWLLAVSAVVHVVVVVVAVMLSPERAQPPHDPLADLGPVVIIERTELDAVTPEPDEPDEAKTPSPPVSEGPASDTAERHPQPRERRTGAARPDEGPVAPDSGVEPDDGEDARAVPLLGLRRHSTASHDAAPRPQVDWRSAAIEHEVAPSHVEEPAGEGDSRLDRQPRSLQDAGFERRRNGDLVYMHPGRAFKATLLPDGRVKFRNLVRNPAKMPGFSEVIRAAQGKEIYQREKKKLLEQTFDLRLAMAITWAQAAMQARLSQLYRDLIELWHDGGGSAAERRRKIFARWDECEEALAVDLGEFEAAAASRLDQARKEAGDAAREKIESFVRTHLPQGSEDAYTPSELRELNARRRSRARFDPY